MYPAFQMRHRTRPLAMMLSADQAPVKSPRSKRLAHSGLSLPWADWRRCVLGLLLFTNDVYDACVVFQLPAATGITR